MSTAADHITARIAELGDWRGETLAKLRGLIHDADPAVVEAWKWRGVPVWEHDGGLCTGESYKEVVKLTFFRGASLPDPKKLFNASLEGGTRRAIDVRQGDEIDEAAFKALIRAAVAANVAAKAPKQKLGAATSKKPASTKPASTKPASKKPASTKPASTKPASKKPASKKPASKKAR